MNLPDEQPSDEMFEWNRNRIKNTIQQNAIKQRRKMINEKGLTWLAAR
jgi:hypothetical protein